MPSTKNLQDTITWCGAYINFQPLTIGGVDPAVSIANMILQTLLGPPFCWRWNRATATFTAAQISTVWQQDYAVSISDLGFIEKAWLTSADGKVIKELEVKNALSATSEAGRPMRIAAQGDDNAGNITFRLMPVPDQAYVVKILYQKKPPLMNCLASKWSPVPDELAYIYNWGFLALASMMSEDPRFNIFMQKFNAHLLGAQEGIDDLQRNIYLGSWLEITKQAERANAKTSQGIAARQQ